MASARLKEYRRRRDFHRTSEPKGGPGRMAGNLYVIQKHAARRLHYDFRLELDGVLKSWAVPRGPSLNPADKRQAVHVEDHPLEYGEFEGIIPKGQYGGGTVMLWDHGWWEGVGDARSHYRKGRLKFKLHGKKLRGAWTLVRMRGRTAEGEKNWLLIKERDEQARTPEQPDILDERPESVASQRSLDGIGADRDTLWEDGSAIEQDAGKGRSDKSGRRKPRNDKDVSGIAAIQPGRLAGARKSSLPKGLRPQLATLVSEVPSGEQWLHEIKFDGYRILCILNEGRARLLSRNGRDLTDKFRRVAQAATAIPVDLAILDGELVALKSDGSTDSQTLQNVLKDGASARLIYYVFDLPYCGGYSLMRTPLVERKRLLRQLLGSAPGDCAPLRYVDHVEGQGAGMYEQACAHALEGIISKRAHSLYQSRRTRSWVKIKCIQSQEFVIGGYTDPEGTRTHFGALLLGYYDSKEGLVYCGRVGTGFNARSLRRIHAQLSARQQRDPPFDKLPRDFKARGVHWVRPELVAQATFSNWTDDGLLRQASFHGLREDKKPQEIVREQSQPVERLEKRKPPQRRRAAPARMATAQRAGKQTAIIAGQRLTNPDRVLYPEQKVTKKELALFYERIADWILPHVTGRLLSLVRCPQGRSKSCFFQKHINESLPDAIRGVPIQERNKRGIYIVIRDLPGLIALVQLGVLEIHPWGGRADKPERPDRMVFDLDPAPGLAWKQVGEGARTLRDRLCDLDLKSFVKTSGGKGLHVVVPLAHRTGWDEFKSFAKAVAVDIARREPKRYTATVSKSKRTGKIFIDYLRNARGATSVAAYSTRARAGAPVSAPLHWDELDAVKSGAAYTLATLPRRLDALDEDPWQGFFDVRQSLTAKMRTSVGAG